MCGVRAQVDQVGGGIGGRIADDPSSGAHSRNLIFTIGILHPGHGKWKYFVRSVAKSAHIMHMECVGSVMTDGIVWAIGYNADGGSGAIAKFIL